MHTKLSRKNYYYINIKKLEKYINYINMFLDNNFYVHV